MRFREFVENPVKNKLLTILRNVRGRAASKGAAAELTWSAINKMFGTMAIDYETFKAMFDENPQQFEKLVQNFNSDGVTLDVPGVSKEPRDSDKEDSQDKVNDIAAKNAENNLD